MSSELLDKGYEPRDVEQRCYDYWMDQKLFAAKDADDRNAYAIVIPPPNGMFYWWHGRRLPAAGPRVVKIVQIGRD